MRIDTLNIDGLRTVPVYKNNLKSEVNEIDFDKLKQVTFELNGKDLVMVKA